MVKIIRLLIAVVMAVAVAGCEFKEPIDSDIEGFWKLERFETNADGRMYECRRIYYSITRYVVEVSEKQGPNGYGTFIGRFGYKDGRTKVVMKDFKHRANTSDNGVSATVNELKPFGINSLETTFDVVVADGDNLVLRSDYATLQLTRF
mgnify:FL=1